jgi:Transposase IS66 family
LQNFTGILQADAYNGLNALFEAERQPTPITPAFCWAHSRRQFFELADIANATAISPIALDAVKRIDALFEIEREINGLSAEERLLARRERSAPLLVELEAWLRDQRNKLSRSSNVLKPINYMPTVGTALLVLQRTAESAPRTMLPNVRCAVWLWAEKPGCSLGPIAAPTGPLSCSPSS